MWSNDFINVPFKDHGRSRQGSDCWGLVRIIYKERLGINLPSYDNDYSDTNDRKGIAEHYHEHKDDWVRIQPGKEKEYDVAVFKMLNLPTHVAVVIKPPLMVHCERGCGTYVSDYLEEKAWSKRLEGFYRHARNTDNPSSVST